MKKNVANIFYLEDFEGVKQQKNQCMEIIINFIFLYRSNNVQEFGYSHSGLHDLVIVRYSYTEQV